MKQPILYSFRRCPYAMRARMAIYLADIECELREVYLKNKPAEMLKISPKGTVPVLQLEDRIIDESNDIIQWALSQNSKKLMVLNLEQQDFTLKIIHKFDTDFKHHLDRYKYSQRYNTDSQNHRDFCDEILVELDKSISDSKWIFSDEVSLLDISILPFIRQFKIADSDYFFNQKYSKVIKLLNQFEDSSLFQKIMNKYEVWSASDNNSVLFPKRYKPIVS